MSRVYAFEPFPPFDIVVRSGFFCLGYVPHQGTSIVNVSSSSSSLSLLSDNKNDDEAMQSNNEQIWGGSQ